MNDLAPLPVALPFLMAALLMATSAWLPRRPRDLVAIGTAAAVTVICGWLAVQSTRAPIIYWFGGWTPHDGVALGISFAIDPIGAGLAALSALLVTASLIFSWRYFDQIGALFPTLMLVFLGAMTGFCLTGDLFNLFVFFELMSVAAYALTGYKIEEEPALMGAFNFAVTNSLGAFFVLIGIGLLYGRTGALNLAQIGRALAAGPADGLVTAALVLVTIGFGVKTALVPLHFWLDDAHAVAPTPVCVLFSGTMVELGLYAIARVYWTVFSGAWALHAAALSDVWIGFAALTALVGGVMCFAQRHLKRMLAFSTISHVGMFFLGFALFTPLGLAGAAIDVLAHGLIKGALFLAAGILLNRFESVDVNELQGRGKRFPWLGALFVLGGLGLADMPPLGTCLGRTLMEGAARSPAHAWIAALFLISSALTGGAVLRSAGQIFLGLGPKQDIDAGTPKKEQTETREKYDRAPLVMIVPVAMLLGLAVVVGLSSRLERETLRAAAGFVNREAYAATVLEGKAELDSSPPSPALPERWSGIIDGLASSGLALILALIALFPQRLPQAVRKPARYVGLPALKLLRGLHSGQVDDYVTWIVVAAAVMGGLLACVR